MSASWGMSPIERARGHWRTILSSIGIRDEFMRNKHGPCPLCGGRDRYRFDDLNGEGTYFCNQCGPGNGFTMLRKHLGLSNHDAMREIERIIGRDALPIWSPATEQSEGSAFHQAAIEKLLSEATDEGVVVEYLARRGIDVGSPVLLGHPECPYYDTKTGRRIGAYPAVIAPILCPEGRLISAQRVYLADVDTAKKNMTPARKITGGAVRLFEAAAEMGVCEGWETGLAAHQLFKMPIWAGLSDNGMLQIELPMGVEKLHIFGDNDASYAGQTAAFALAKKANRDGIAVEVHIPSKVGTDWLDQLIAGKGMV